MTLRFASLLATAALAAMAAPGLAQDGYDPGPPSPLPAWDEELHEYPDDDYLDDEDAWEDRGPPPHAAPQAMSYPPEQRAAWLGECRVRYHDANGRARGQVIGGLLVAVAGSVVGSEIAEGDDNLGGTLIGAGVGGLAGAAIGGEVGAEADRAHVDQGADRHREPRLRL